MAADLSSSDEESGAGQYSEVSTNRMQQRVRSHMAESARRASLQAPGTGLYSIIRKEDLVVSTPSTSGVHDDDNNEKQETEHGRPIESSYSMITRESMTGYVSEELSDVAEVDEEEEEKEEEEKAAVPSIVVEQVGTLARQKAEVEDEEDSRPRLATPPSD